MAAGNHVFSAFSFIAFILVCIPFPWHLQAWNTGTCLYMAWTALGCFVLFINSIIWDGNTINRAPVWCDISTKIIIGCSVAILAATLCINRRLYHIASIRSAVTKTVAEKRRAIAADLSIGIGIPVFVMILHYVVQGHRFDIFEDVGCFPTTYNTPLAYVLVWSPPIAIGLVSATYSVFSIFAFQRRRDQFKEIISSNSELNTRRYFRLMALAGTGVALSVPLGVTTICLQATRGVVEPWISWEDTHFNFSSVPEIPAVYWRSIESGRVPLEMTRWLVVISALIFFCFFGFADEAVKHYKLTINTIGKRLGYTMQSESTKTSSSFGNLSLPNFKFSKVEQGRADLPVYVSREVFEKRDSIDSHVSGMTFEGSDGGRESPFNTLVKPTLVVDTAAESDKKMDKGNLAAVGRLSPGCFPISASPSPSTSFLDLSVTCVDESPITGERRV